jgi:hypothetical protein
MSENIRLSDDKESIIKSMFSSMPHPTFPPTLMDIVKMEELVEMDILEKHVKDIDAFVIAPGGMRYIREHYPDMWNDWKKNA